MPASGCLADHMAMRKRLSSLLFALVLLASFAASAGQASANPGNGSGTSIGSGTLTTYGITWE